MTDDALLGWSTPWLILHDFHVPGVLRRVLKSTALGRQAIYAALASQECAFNAAEDQSPSQRRRMMDTNHSEMLRYKRPVEILGAVFGYVPDGLMGALERCGFQPLSADQYATLYRVYSEPNCRLVNALRYVGPITSTTLEVAEALIPELVDHRVIERLSSVAAAHALNDAVRFLRKVNSHVTDAAIQEAIDRLQPGARVEVMLRRFLKRADRLPPHPLNADEEITPLESVAALIAASRKYRNCMRSYIGHVLSGVVAFAEFQGVLILELKPLSNGSWLLVDTHARMNGCVEPDLHDAAAARCASQGIASILDQPRQGSNWNSIARMVRRWDWMED